MMSYKRKVIGCLLVSTTFLTTIGMGGNVLVDTLAVHAEQTISSNGVADNISNRSITIWKYQIKDASELGERGNGEATDVDKIPLTGIKFSIQKVKPLNGASLTDPLKSVLGTDYEVIAETGNLATGVDGSAKIDLGVGTAVDGIYLVTELPDDRDEDPKVAKPADPFFVYVPQTKRDDRSSLIYDVEVQPKNILESLLDPDKTIEEGKGHSIKAGEKFDWEATTNIPAGLYTIASQDMVITPVYDKDGKKIEDIAVTKGDEIYANYYKITDKLNASLLLDNVKVQTKIGEGSLIDLEFNKDYTVFVNDAEQTGEPITDTGKGEKTVVVSLTQAGMKKVATNKHTQIRVTYTTHTDKDFNGSISNHFDVTYLTPGLKPVDVPSGTDPEFYVGGFDIEKTGEDTKAVLKGAEFHISATKADAEAGKFLAENGKIYATEKEATEAGTKLLIAISDKAGRAMFNGLPLVWFNDVNKNGKQDSNEPTFAKEDIKQSYWVVETKAPEGYELLKAPQEVTVTLTSHEKQTVELNVVDKAKTDLPFTGGTGATLLVIVALSAITIGTVAISIDKKRRHA